MPGCSESLKGVTISTDRSGGFVPPPRTCLEVGCKTLIGARLKRSGMFMFWSVRGANTIIALHCCRLSGRFGDYWESRSSAA